MKLFVVFSTVLVVCAYLHAAKAEKKPCADNLSAYYCAFLAKHRACHRNPVRMAVYCRKTCGYCVQKQTCATMTCPPSKICVTTESGAKCKCLFECKKKLNIGPVCGQNGKTYDDMCDLINAGCATGDYLMVRHYGKCEKTSLKCRDSERESKKGLCKSWAEAKSCIYHSAYMRRFCPKTCGFCRQPIEPRCKRSKYGCCWHTQGDVAAKGKYGQGCGVCKDQRFCKFFRKACGEVKNGNADIMKKLCPETCLYCKNVSKGSSNREQ